MFDFQKAVADFFIKNPFLFTEYNISSSEYFEYFFPDGPCSFRIPFLVKVQPLVDELKDRIVQTYQTIENGNIIQLSLFQISKDEHILIAYTSFENVLCCSVSLHLKSLQRIPFWLEKLDQYSFCGKKQQQVGFAQFTK